MIVMTKIFCLLRCRIANVLPTAKAASRRTAAFVVLGIGLLLPSQVRAQGEGPRTYWPAPDGTNILVVTYMNLSTNMNFNQSAVLRDAEIDINLAVPTYKHFFSMGGHLSEFVFSPIFGTLSGSVGVANRQVDVPRKTGAFDPYIGVRVGLAGAPALKLPEFMKHEQGFQLYGLFGIYAPLGQYDGSKPVNLGTNHWGIRLGAPMVMPFGKPTRPVTLEVNPTVTFFTDNNDPFGPAESVTQKPLIQVENHLSHNFTKDFWGSIDLRYQYGGETKTDGVENDNPLNQLGGGPTLGYQITPKFSVQGSYGRVLFKAGSDDSKSNMIRLRAVYVF